MEHGERAKDAEINAPASEIQSRRAFRRDLRHLAHEHLEACLEAAALWRIGLRELVLHAHRRLDFQLNESLIARKGSIP